VFKDRIFMRIFGLRSDDVRGDWRELHNEELNDLYASPNIVRVTKSRRMRFVVHVARMGERKGVYRVFVGQPDKVDHLENQGVDRRIILRLIFRKWDERVGN